MIVKYRIGKLKGEFTLSDSLSDEEALKEAKIKLHEKVSYFPIGEESWDVIRENQNETKSN